MAETQSGKSGDRNLPQAERKHPDEWERDLNPDHMAGQNIGERGSVAEQPHRTAFDVKEVHRSLRDIADDELRVIPILPEGTRLEQGATYLDLEERREFTASGDMQAERDRHVVPKSAVPYPTYNRLRGVTDPERLDTGNTEGADRSGGSSSRGPRPRD